ncbi:unnamed protein product [Polarella glacialis]|uniref:Uncharacterized protein n=1 Tax=Polarella glacialis TaxID=89957 RepID=A0A813LEQ4_POLGL|nr:unnamed protein product [Polarella glacialis]
MSQVVVLPAEGASFGTWWRAWETRRRPSSTRPLVGPEAKKSWNFEFEILQQEKPQQQQEQEQQQQPSLPTVCAVIEMNRESRSLLLSCLAGIAWAVHYNRFGFVRQFVASPIIPALAWLALHGQSTIIGFDLCDSSWLLLLF